MANIVAQQWKEMFQMMQSKSHNQTFKYFNIRGVDYNGVDERGKPIYPNLAVAVKNEYSRSVKQLRSTNRISSVGEMEKFLDEKIQQEISLERAYYSELASKISGMSGNEELKTTILANLGSLQGKNVEDYHSIINTLKDTLKKMYAFTNSRRAKNPSNVNGAYNFSKQITSREIYDKLTPEVNSFFSRNALLGSIGRKGEYKQSINKINENLGNALIDEMFFKGKRVMQVQNATVQALQLNIGSGLGKVLAESLGGKDVFSPSIQGKSRTIDSLKAAFKTIARNNAKRALQSGERFKDKKVQTKVHGKVVNYLVSLDEKSLKITDENNIIVVQVGMEAKVGFDNSNTLTGEALVKSFHQIIKETLLLVSSAATEKAKSGSTNEQDAEKLINDANEKESAAKWFSKNGLKFLKDTLGLNKIKAGQPIDEETVKRINGLRIFSASGVSGILGELSAASLKYAGFGDTTMAGNTQVEGSQSYYDIAVETSINEIGKFGIQVKNKVTSDKLVNLYGDKTDLTMKSTVGLRKYIGADNVKMFQYFLGNQRAVERFNYNNLNLASEDEIKMTLEEVLPSYITQFIRYEGVKKDSIKNLFYLLKGELIPSSVILYLLKLEYIKQNGNLISINVVGDMFSTPYQSPARGAYPPNKVKNLMNNNHLAKTIIQFRGLDVDVSKLIG